MKIKKSEQVKNKIELYKFYLKGLLALEERLDANPFLSDKTEMIYYVEQQDANSTVSNVRISLCEKKASYDYNATEPFYLIPMITTTVTFGENHKKKNTFRLSQGADMVITTNNCSAYDFMEFRKFINALCEDITV